MTYIVEQFDGKYRYVKFETTSKEDALEYADGTSLEVWEYDEKNICDEGEKIN
jgi:hypothetical protein